MTHTLRAVALLALLATPLSFAAEAPAEAERLLPDKEQERMMALADSQPADTETLWLETQHESFLGLFQPANQPDPRGGILLLPHDRTSPDWPGAMQTLRRGMPDKGWHTLAIALPDEPLPILPRIQGTSAAAASTTPGDGTSATPDHDTRISQRIDQALATLRERGASKIYLVGEGSGGYWASRYVGENSGQRLYPILIDAAAPSTQKTPLHQLTAKLTIPTLDLYHSGGLERAANERAAKLRHDAAKRQGLRDYLSVRMPPKVGDWRQTVPRLLALVNGLIERHMEPATRPKPQVDNPPAKGQQRPGRRS